MKTIRVLLLMLLAWLFLPTSVAAFYNPSTGRWLSRDPYTASNERNDYGFVLNAAVGAFDPDGRLTIAQVPNSYKPGACGAYSVQWRFNIEHWPTPCPPGKAGYYVQKIEIDEDSTFVCTQPRTKKPTYTFWEASPLPQIGQAGADLSVLDSAALANRIPSRGINTSKGTVRFFCLDTDLSSDSKWAVGKVPEALTLLSTYDQPIWWDSPAPNEKEVTRSVTAKWNCCCADPTLHISKITVTP